MEKMQYDEAYTTFAKVLNYKDSKEKRAIIESVYELQRGNNGQAIRQLLKNGTIVRLEYDTDGGTQEGTIYVYQSLTEFGELQKTEKNGYRFEGWAYEKSAYDADKSEIAITLKANWTAIPYFISYQLDGGVVEGSNPVLYTIESENIKFIHPTKERYTFVGWTWEGNSEPVKDAVLLTGNYGDKVFTANWEPTKFTVTLIANGGSLSETTVESSSIEALNLPVPQREHYEFVGWYDSKGERVYLDFFPDLYYYYNWEGEITLTAKWKPVTYYIAYNLGGVVAKHANPLTYTIESKTVTLAAARAEGTRFMGWYSDKDYTKQIKEINPQELQGNITLYAKWGK